MILHSIIVKKQEDTTFADALKIATNYHSMGFIEVITKTSSWHFMCNPKNWWDRFKSYAVNDGVTLTYGFE